MTRRTTILLVATAILLPAAAFAQICGGNSPAVPVPECRSSLDGTEVACNDPDAVRMWPDGFRPGEPGRTFPIERDSTQYNTTTIPGAISGHELFQSVYPLDGYLYVAYNAGLQVWDIHTDPEVPQLVFVRDGWNGDFLDFPFFGENDFFVDDVSAIRSGDDALVALSGRTTVGFGIWRHVEDPASFDQLYQDLGNRSIQTRSFEFGGNLYAFAAGQLGVFAYDLTAAEALAGPCLDDGGSVCPGVFLGKVGATGFSSALDVLQRGGNVYVVRSGSAAAPIEIWEVSDPATPGTAVSRFSGLPAGAWGVSLFERGGVAYLGVVEKDGGASMLRIYDVDACLDADGCGSLGAPVYTRALGMPFASPQYLTYSTSFGTPFLYYGANGFGLEGIKAELLLDLGAFPGGAVTEITDGGGSYTDACTGNTVDYWGDYYPGNGNGLRNVRPLVGRFDGAYFYRAAFGILDVHVNEGAGVIFFDGFESGDTSAW
jgi:hypothetical protein